jgi:tetratricopeptide (TPR) repeat protein
MKIQEALSEKRTLKYVFIFTCFAYFSIFTIFTNVSWKNEKVLRLAIARKYPLSTYAQINLGEVLLEQGNYPEALKKFNFVLSQAPQNSDPYELMRAYFNLALIYMRQGKYESAEQMYKEALKLFPSMPYIYVALGGCYGIQGLYEKALEQYNIAKKINPSFPLAYIKSGIVYMWMHRYPEAKSEFLTALKIYPESNEAKMYLERITKE